MGPKMASVSIGKKIKMARIPHPKAKVMAKKGIRAPKFMSCGGVSVVAMCFLDHYIAASNVIGIAGIFIMG